VNPFAALFCGTAKLDIAHIFEIFRAKSKGEISPGILTPTQADYAPLM
jgi:hypothetical protein